MKFRIFATITVIVAAIVLYAVFGRNNAETPEGEFPTEEQVSE